MGHGWHCPFSDGSMEQLDPWWRPTSLGWRGVLGKGAQGCWLVSHLLVLELLPWLIFLREKSRAKDKITSFEGCHQKPAASTAAGLGWEEEV